MILFITGGVRSGKSSYAQQLALKLTDQPAYLATSREPDPEFQDRIRRHQEERGPEWETLEIPLKISEISTERKVVVVDCITLWLSNFFSETKGDMDESLRLAKLEIDRLSPQKAWIIISNEIGMGLHAETEIGRKFTDLQGWVNQYIAGKADEVVFMVSGIPMKIKS